MLLAKSVGDSTSGAGCRAVASLALGRDVGDPLGQVTPDLFPACVECYRIVSCRTTHDWLGTGTSGGMIPPSLIEVPLAR
jgi:hypothetical protein